MSEFARPIESLGKDEWYGEWFKCPKCGSVNIKGKVRYCDQCGVRLKWDNINVLVLKDAKP